MLKGVQAGFKAFVGGAILADLKRLGVDGVRIDCQGLPPFEVRLLAQEVLDAHLRVLCLVRDPHEITQLPPDLDVEVGAEPDLHGPPAPICADRIAAVHAVAAARGLRTWAPTISNLNRRGLDYLGAILMRLAPDIGISIHRYPRDTCLRSGFAVPHEGFASRDAEVAALKALIGHRPFGVSEVGYHTAKRPIKVLGLTVGTRRWHDHDVAAHLRREFAFWQGHGAAFVVVYQLNDGDTDTALDRYGLRRTNGNWKPSASVFRGY